MISIDIRDMLKQSNVDEALPHIGNCHYDAPCIVGTVLAKDERVRLDNHPTDTDVKFLLNEGELDAPDEQHYDLGKLQQTFDSGNREVFLDQVDHLRRKYGVKA